MIAALTRTDTGPTGTFGRLWLPGFTCHTVEPRWLGNQRDVSCIPPGDYCCGFWRSPRFGWTYRVIGVPDRDHILFHAGNWAGGEGLMCDSLGCILPGASRMKLQGQDAVTSSRTTLRRMMEFLDQRSFSLRIINSWEAQA